VKSNRIESLSYRIPSTPVRDVQVAGSENTEVAGWQSSELGMKLGQGEISITTLPPPYPASALSRDGGGARIPYRLQHPWFNAKTLGPAGLAWQEPRLCSCFTHGCRRCSLFALYLCVED
jgi:hypothetical protein